MTVEILSAFASSFTTVEADFRRLNQLIELKSDGGLNHELDACGVRGLDVTN